MIYLFGKKSYAYNVGVSMVPPIAMAFFNSFFIPMFVYYVSQYLFFETKYEKEKSKMHKYFFYMLLISFIMPLLNQSELLKVFKILSEEGIGSI
jgi:hypothetical protein